MLSGCRIGNRRLKSALRRREAILVGAGISDVCQGWCHPLGLGTGPDDEIGLKSETPLNGRSDGTVAGIFRSGGVLLDLFYCETPSCNANPEPNSIV